MAHHLRVFDAPAEGSQFLLQHPHGDLQPIPVPEDMAASPYLHRHQAPGIYTFIQAGKTFIYIE